MPGRYEVRGPNGDRKDPYRWSVWDREKDCPATRVRTRDEARESMRAFEAGDVYEGEGVELDQLPTILRILRGN